MRWGWWLALLVGCGGGNASDDAMDAGPDADESDVGRDAIADGDKDASPDAPFAGTVRSVSFPQAIHGAMSANPLVYDEIPVHVLVDGDPATVVVELDGSDTDAEPDPDHPGEWIAHVSLYGFGDRPFDLVATARGADDTEATASAELVVASTGVRVTRFDESGLITTPYLNRTGDDLLLSFIDHRDDAPRAWLREIDGGGRPIGDDVPLDLGGLAPIYVRTAVWEDRIGVLFQRSGAPFANFFRLFDRQGTPVTDVIALDPPGRGGMSESHITVRDGVFSVVFRTNHDIDASDIRFARIDAETGELTGPTVVAVERDTVDGMFDPASYVRVAAGDDGTSFVSFTRREYVDGLELWLPRTEIAVLDADGAVVSAEPPAEEEGFGLFHWESHVFRAADSVVAVWIASALEEDPETPQLMYGARYSTSGERDGDAATLVDAADLRYEPYLIEHPRHASGVLLWADARSYALGIDMGRIELYVSPMGEHLETSDPVVFEHARLFANVAHIRGANAATNTVITWLDDRRSTSAFNRKAEIYLDTAWE